MSVEHVKSALKAFAVSGTNEAIVLKGEWGTGKTFIWKSTVADFRAEFTKPHYSYASLFGLNSLKDLKTAIFESTVDKPVAHEKPSFLSLVEKYQSFKFHSKIFGRKVFGRASEANIPYVKGLGSVVESMQFAAIRNTLICLDDFERKGSGLQDREVFGLISHLVEMKDCSVILILNQSALEDGKEYRAFNEKVFDREVVYNPSIQESVSLVFNPLDETRRFIYHNCIKLGLNNIRILKKIAKFADILDEYLIDSSTETKAQAHLVLPLAVYSLYSGHSTPVDIEFVSQHSIRIEDFMAARNNDSEEQSAEQELNEARNNFLDNYGFTECDEFSASIINLVKTGYTDPEAIQTQIDALAKQVQHEADVGLLKAAWVKFHASFKINDSEVFQAFENSFDVALSKFSVSDLDAVAMIYHDAGKVQRIQEIIDIYFSEVMVVSGIKSPAELYRWPDNAYLLSKLAKYFSSLQTDKTFSEIMEEAFFTTRLNGAELRNRLAAKSEDEFYEFFSNLEIPHFSDYVNICLEGGKVMSADLMVQVDLNTIFLNTYRTLIKLSELSLLNKSRMQKFKSFEPVYLEMTYDIKRRQDKKDLEK